MEDDAQKEEQRLMRTMNNRVNAALQNKPKANFTFNIGGGGLSAASPSSPQKGASPVVQSPPFVSSSPSPSPASYTSPPINFSAPQNFATPSSASASSSVSSSSTKGYAGRGMVSSRSNENIESNAAPSSPSLSASASAAAPEKEIIKHSHLNPEEEMKALFADDKERRMKMEEDRLTRTLGKRSYVAPKSSAHAAAPFVPNPSVSVTPPHSAPPVFAPSPVTTSPPSHAPAPSHAHAHAAVPSHAHAPSHAPIPNFAPDINTEPSPPPPIIEADIFISPPLSIPEAEPAGEVHTTVMLVDAGDVPPGSIVSTIDDVLSLAKDIAELDIPLEAHHESDFGTQNGQYVATADLLGDLGQDGNVQVDVSVVTNDPEILNELLSEVPEIANHNHHETSVPVHHNDASKHANTTHSHGNVSANVNLLADIIGNTQQEVKTPAEVTRFRSLVDSAAKSLKAEKPINGDEVLAALETIGKLVIGIVPTIPDQRLSVDVKNAAVELVKESITFKHAWQNWSDLDEIIPKVIAKLGILYVNVAAVY